MMIKSHIAQKDHTCSDCGLKIPKGHRYFRAHEEDGFVYYNDEKTHTNCELYKKPLTARELYSPKKGGDYGKEI
jgi:hypothetical protein